MASNTDVVKKLYYNMSVLCLCLYHNMIENRYFITSQSRTFPVHYSSRASHWRRLFRSCRPCNYSPVLIEIGVVGAAHPKYRLDSGQYR